MPNTPETSSHPEVTTPDTSRGLKNLADSIKKDRTKSESKDKLSDLAKAARSAAKLAGVKVATDAITEDGEKNEPNATTEGTKKSNESNESTTSLSDVEITAQLTKIYAELDIEVTDKNKNYVLRHAQFTKVVTALQGKPIYKDYGKRETVDTETLSDYKSLLEKAIRDPESLSEQEKEDYLAINDILIANREPLEVAGGVYYANIDSIPVSEEEHAGNDGDPSAETGPNGTEDGIEIVNSVIKPNKTGNKLAKAAEATAANMGGARSLGRCYNGVWRSLTSLGHNGFVTGGSAYMAADQLAAKPNFFTEVTNNIGLKFPKRPDKSDADYEALKRLPKGAIVVWGRNQRKPHGHISIALGNGMESSDHKFQQYTFKNVWDEPRVFMPKDFA